MARADRKDSAIPRVVATAPFVQGQVIVEHDERRLAPTIRGIDPEQEEKVISLQKFVKWGKLDLDGDTTVLGIELARQLDVQVGDKVTVYSPGNLSTVLDRIKKLESAKGDEKKRSHRRTARSRASEGSDSDRNLRDRSLCTRFSVSAGPAFHRSRSYNVGGALQGITVETEDPYDVDEEGAEIEKFLEAPPVRADSDD